MSNYHNTPPNGHLPPILPPRQYVDEEGHQHVDNAQQYHPYSNLPPPQQPQYVPGQAYPHYAGSAQQHSAPFILPPLQPQYAHGPASSSYAGSAEHRPAHWNLPQPHQPRYAQSQPHPGHGGNTQPLIAPLNDLRTAQQARIDSLPSMTSTAAAGLSARLQPELVQIYGQEFAYNEEKKRTFVNLGLQDIISSFVRFIMPALYSEWPDYYNMIAQHVATYHINPPFLLVTKYNSRSNLYSDIRVPALTPAPATPKRRGGPFAIRLSRREENPTFTAMPTPLEYFTGDGQVTAQTEGFKSFHRGDWAMDQKEDSIDAGRCPALRASAKSVYWRYKQLAAPVEGYFDSVWDLIVSWEERAADGSTRTSTERLRIHFDNQLGWMQNRFETEYNTTLVVPTASNPGCEVGQRGVHERARVFDQQQQ